MTTKQSDCNNTDEIDFKNHWNTAYTKNTTEKLGWYEQSSAQTIQLIKASKVSKNAKILNIGVGSSMLIDELLEDDYTHLIANDLSAKAIENLQERLGKQASKITCIVDDVIHPEKLQNLQSVDVWNDRATLHFFLKEEEQHAYFKLLKQLVSVDGFVIIAVFALDGAEKCCGLPLQRYDVAGLQEKLGTDFSLIESFNYTFMNPYGGERPYIYTLFKRKSK